MLLAKDLIALLQTARPDAIVYFDDGKGFTTHIETAENEYDIRILLVPESPLSKQDQDELEKLREDAENDAAEIGSLEDTNTELYDMADESLSVVSTAIKDLTDLTLKLRKIL